MCQPPSCSISIAQTVSRLAPIHHGVQGVQGPQGDVYALGCCLWEMMHCQRMWVGRRLVDVVRSLRHNKGPAYQPALPEHLTVSMFGRCQCILDCWVSLCFQHSVHAALCESASCYVNGSAQLGMLIDSANVPGCARSLYPKP